MDNDIIITPGEPEDIQGPIKFEPLGFHRVSAPELTDRAKLAMQIYTREITSPDDYATVVQFAKAINDGCC